MTPRTYELYMPGLIKALLVFFAIFSVCMPIGLLFLPLDGPPLSVRVIFPAVLAWAWHSRLLKTAYLLRCTAFFVTAAYAKVRRIPQNLRALHPSIFDQPV
jgi:hypothetical protein